MSLLVRVTGSVLFLTNNCYCKLPSNCVKMKLYKRNFSKVSVKSERCCGARFMCTAQIKPQMDKKNHLFKFDQHLAFRRDQAEKSIVVEVPSLNVYPELYAYCSNFGEVQKMFHYTTITDKDFILVAFREKQDVKNILNSSSYANYSKVIPVNSTILYYSKGKPVDSKMVPVGVFKKNSCRGLNYMNLMKRLYNANSISDQMTILYDNTKINEASLRLRYYTAHQIEKCYKSLLPDMAVLPFGSSVNGFGKNDCDLDLCMIFNRYSKEITESRLTVQSKPILYSDKNQTKRIMEVFAETINIFLPGIVKVKKVLNAKVPIIKFDHSICGMQCDLTMSNMTAYYMSELLYTFGEIDSRVRPLTFIVRNWAESLHLVDKVRPSPCITNFSLTLMVIFFLQQKNILPTVETLKSKAEKDDTRIADVYVDCTFIRDVKKLAKTKNMDSLESLLKDFFIYYRDFEYEKYGLSLKVGKPVLKPELFSLYISNPLQASLNVSNNVDKMQTQRICKAMRDAASFMENPVKLEDRWGLMDFLNLKSISSDVQFKSKNAISMQELFNMDEEMQNTA